MLYTGYTKTELDSLLALLDKINVPYEVLMDDGQAAERSRQRGDASILRVEIPDEALMAIPEQYFSELERFRIYPQFMEVPLEHFQDAPKPEGVVSKPKSNAMVKWITLAMAAGMILMVFAQLKG